MKRALTRVTGVGLFLVSLLASTNAGASEGGVTLILRGGTVVPMTAPHEQHEAIAISGSRIVGLGSDEEIDALRGVDTTVVDLEGLAVLPGFIDPHAHFFGNSSDLDEIQQRILESGVTSVAEMHTGEWQIANWITYAQDGGMRIRNNLYCVYIDSCGTVHGNWYDRYPPKSELASRLYMGGVKLFMGRSICGESRAVAPVFSDVVLANTPAGFTNNPLLLSPVEFTDAIQYAHTQGYQVAIHAIGDLGIDTALDALKTVLQGEGNALRHMILHNRVIRDDQLSSYRDLDIVALIELLQPYGQKAWGSALGEKNVALLWRWRDLVETGIHVALNSDGPRSEEDGQIEPMNRLYAAVTGKQYDDRQDSGEMPEQTVSAWQGLRMMTTEAAYALHWDNELGTLEQGKLADLVVLSRNPLEEEPERLREIKTVMTVVDGCIEFATGGFEHLVGQPALVATAATEAPPENTSEGPSPQEEQDAGAVSADAHDAEVNAHTDDVSLTEAGREPRSLGLPSVDWVASINEDENPNPVDNYAKVLEGIDEYGHYFGMEWNSPEFTDLGLNSIDQFDRNGTEAISLTLAASKPMEVEVWVSTDSGYCGPNWNAAVSSIVLDVGLTPAEFLLPAASFGRHPFVPCDEIMSSQDLEHLISIILLPSSRDGKLRVYALALCLDASPAD
jgi:predicted amidohydrolase YtcJ